MRDERFQELLDEIKAKQSQIRYEVLFGCGMVGLGIATVFLIGQTGLLILALSVPAWIAGRWLDSYKRRSVLFYELDDEATKAYEAMTHAFDDMMRCSGKWHLQASGVVRDLNTWKHSAGATQTVSSKATTLAYSVPKVIATNITPPSIQAGRQTIHFFPDVAFVVEGNKVGAIGYGNLDVQWKPSPFIEERTVPADAKIIRYTWRYPNKKGGPDRRFSNNYQIPVCLYEEAYFTSKDGLNELIQFSRTGVVEPFSNALHNLARRTQQAKTP